MNWTETKIGRREVLMGAAGIGIGFAAGKVEGISSRFLPSVPEGRDIIPYAIHPGPIAIYRGVNIRTSPQIPDRTFLKKPSNNVDWPTIHSVNGVPINEDPFLGAFVMDNPELAEGVDASSLWTFFPEIKNHKSPWIKLRLNLFDGTKNLPAYISYYGAEPFVSRLTAGYITGAGDRNHEGIFGDETGNVWIPKSKERIARDIVPQIWARKINKKLDGTTPLRPSVKSLSSDGQFDREYPGEKIIESAIVVASGDRSLEDKIKMEQNQTRINVRNYPGKFFRNDEPVEILGTVKQGTEIKNVLIKSDEFREWAAARREDIQGELYDSKGDPVKINPKQVIAIWNDYLQY